MRTVPLLVAAVAAIAPAARAGEIVGYDPSSSASHLTYDRFASGFPSAPVANTSPSFVAAGQDLSGVGWLRDAPGFAVTLISPQHVVGAAHQGFGNGVLRFVNPDGVVKTYTVQSTTVITTPGQPGNPPSDLLLGTLTAAVPAADRIATVPIAAGPTAAFIGRGILAYGQNATYGTSPHLGLNTIDDVQLAQLGVNPSERTRVALYDFDNVPGEFRLIAGDSGGPALTRVGNQLGLVGVHYGVDTTADPIISASTFVPEYIDALNAAMAGSGYQVTLLPVPEPASGVLLVGMAAGLWAARRRSRNGKAQGRPSLGLGGR